jgi:hypothetical protein
LSSCKTESAVEINVLHKALSGDDSFYHLSRTWTSDYTAEQLAIWSDYFATVLVCDTRAGSSEPCPSGYSKVQ